MAGAVLQGTSGVTADELRRQRDAAGLSTYELADLLGVSPAAVQHWEAGRQPVPRGRVSELRRVLARQAPAAPVPPLLADELRQLRRQAQLSQSDVAHLLGVTREAVTAWERGVKPVPEARRDVLREALAAQVPAAALMRALRERAGWKQAELAERIDVAQTTVSKWERGDKPIPAERWPRIREVLAAAEPDIRPVHFQLPVTPEDVREGVRRLNWTLRDLADALGVPRGTVGPWASGAAQVPPGRWAQVREAFGTSVPVREAEARDRVTEALPLVLAVIDAEPGMGRQEVVRRVDAPEPHARGAILRALEQGRVHERQVPRERADGVVRYLRTLFPGPRPAELPRVDRADVVAPKAVAEIEASPGRSLRSVAEALPYDRRLAERAVARAVRQGAVHERGVVRHTSRGARVAAGLFPGAAPPPATPIAGGVLRRLRERLVLGQAELAERLGVTPALVRRWERSEVPPAWRDAIGAVLRPLGAEADTREADLRRRVVEAVHAQPGVPRWGDLPRHLRSIERSHLSQLLDALIASGELHERPMDNGHGAGLFAGAPPPEWEPGPPIEADELRAMREWAGLPQKELAGRLKASVASVNAWERGTKPVPAYRRAQLRQVLAERKPPEPAPLRADELRAERRRIGWSQTELATQLGVRQTAVSTWERGEVVVPARYRDELRALLAAAPSAPRVSGSELRRWRRAQGLTSQAVAELLGVARTTVVEWQQRGVPRERAMAVLELIGTEARPAQVSLFRVEGRAVAGQDARRGGASRPPSAPPADPSIGSVQGLVHRASDRL
ncbi:MAG: helix-turn-helix domain-containing protein [Thermoleophilaceae bacterium]